MKKINFTLAVLCIVFIFSGCYHAQITTGQEPSAQVYEETMAHGFLFGLVPPNIVNAEDECPNGVAKVETKISFINGLLSAITFSLYTPMHITVTCASASAENLTDQDKLYTINLDDSEDVINEFLLKATEESLRDNKPFYLVMK